MQKDLIKFLVKAKQLTYAGAKGDSKKILVDGSKEFSFSEGVYFYRDRYFGSDPFIGEEVVFSNNEAVWSMNYYGRILDKTIGEKAIYAFLKQSLFAVQENMPLRGPGAFSIDYYSYECKTFGNIDCFSGTESIFFSDKKIYELWFHGGMIS